MTRDNNKKTHYVVLGGKGGGQSESVDWNDIQNKPEFATVATSGSYNDLTDKPEIPGQVNADWDATSGVAQILNKPTLATVATTGSYNDLSNKPAMATETLTFTLQGGTTQTIVVYTQPTV